MIYIAAVCPALGQGEEILRFDSHITVQTNGFMQVSETIRVRAQANKILHGIYRDFPQLYHGGWGLRSQTGFRVLSATRDGKPEEFHLQPQRNGARVYIGSAVALVPPGIYTYELAYETDHQLGFFGTHDELYWNVTGNGWRFPIAEARANVTLPEGAEPGNLEAYTGPQGEKRKDYKASVVDGRAQFETTHPLSSGEGLTIVVSWPKGFVAEPGSGERWASVIEANIGIALALAGLLLGLIYYLAAWAAVGRDPPAGTIVPQYGPPRDFSPAAVRYLARMGFDNRTMTAAILNLAVKGKLTIHEYAEKTYTLFRTDAGIEGLANEDVGLLCK